MDTRIKLRVQGLTNSQVQSGAYALILAEEEGSRRIPIIVGTSEAQSIAIALERIIPPRPLTHDLFATFSQAFGIRLSEVFIYKFDDGVFYSELLFEDDNRSIRLDSRTSDAIAIALRVKCTIYTTEQIVNECGVELEDIQMLEGDDKDDLDESDIEDDLLYTLEPEDLKDEKELQRWLALLDHEELQERLEEAVNEENYEYAKIYKDEIHRRDERDEEGKKP
ncbi:MAG: bifunctional nuclease family protein [Tannerellaceae bacterium]